MTQVSYSGGYNEPSRSKQGGFDDSLGCDNGQVLTSSIGKLRLFTSHNLNSVRNTSVKERTFSHGRALLFSPNQKAEATQGEETLGLDGRHWVC
jgi:hypothetical protein